MWPKWIYTLNDPADRWLGRDKLDHAALAGALWLVVAYAARRGPFAADAESVAWIAVLTAGLAIELFEVLRWRRWRNHTWPAVWPWMTDKLSLKDLVADAAGAAVGHGLLLVAHFAFGW